jgi:tripartite-type tricarboxylate transporter receptor subunit TctC
MGAPAFAQNYPTKPVRIITGSPGAMTDIVTRQIAQRLSERWGQPVVVENHAGGGLIVGTGLAARSTPDGYTLLLADRTSIAVAPNMHKNLSYDPLRDLAPISLVAVAPQLLVAHPSVPAANLREFIDYAKQRPGALDYASAGPGTAIHITGELLKQAAGLDMVPIQYKGAGAAMIAIVSGEVKAGFALMPVALPHVKASKVKAYAITSTKRSSEAPNIPTMAEAGLPAFGSDHYWLGMFAPAHTPAAILGKVNRDLVEILRTPAMRNALLAQGAEPAPGTPEEFTPFIKSETAKLKKLIELTGMRAD